MRGARGTVHGVPSFRSRTAHSRRAARAGPRARRLSAHASSWRSWRRARDACGGGKGVVRGHEHGTRARDAQAARGQWWALGSGRAGQSPEPVLAHLVRHRRCGRYIRGLSWLIRHPEKVLVHLTYRINFKMAPFVSPKVNAVVVFDRTGTNRRALARRTIVPEDFFILLLLEFW